jgi:hypothetical protein
MAATNDQIQQAVESFFLLFNGVVVFRKIFLKKINNKIKFLYILVMSCGYTLIESGGVRSQNAGHSLFKTLLIFSKLNFNE